MVEMSARRDGEEIVRQRFSGNTQAPTDAASSHLTRLRKVVKISKRVRSVLLVFFGSICRTRWLFRKVTHRDYRVQIAIGECGERGLESKYAFQVVFYVAPVKSKVVAGAKVWR